MAFTNVWDNTQPPDTQLANQLGSDLRNFRLDTQQRMTAISGLDASKVNFNFEAGFAGVLYFATDTGLVYQWSGSAWVVMPLLGNKVVAFLDLTGQVANVPVTLVYNVPAGGQGMYRMSCYVIATLSNNISGNTSTLPESDVQFTDPETGGLLSMVISSRVAGGGATVPVNSIGGNTTSGEINQGVFRAKASTAINVFTNAYANNNSFGGNPLTFSLHASLEFLRAI